jgi:hypothetical protein
VAGHANLGILSPLTVTVNGGKLALDIITIAEIPTIHLVGFGAIQQIRTNDGNTVTPSHGRHPNTVVTKLPGDIGRMVTSDVSRERPPGASVKLGILSPLTVTVNGEEKALDITITAEIPTIHLVGFGAIQRIHKNVGNIATL